MGNVSKINNWYNRLKKGNSEDFDDVLREMESYIIMNGKSNATLKSAFNRAMKLTENNTNLHCIYKDNNGEYCLTNKYFIISYGTDKDNVPKELQPYIDEKQDGIDYNNVVYESKNSELNTVSIADVNKIAQYNKINKLSYGDKMIPIKIGNSYFNPNFILDILALCEFKGASITTETFTDSDKVPVNFFIGKGNIKAMLLPIKKPEEKKTIVDNKIAEILKGE